MHRQMLHDTVGTDELFEAERPKRDGSDSEPELVPHPKPNIERLL
jgi:hypothetical protein